MNRLDQINNRERLKFMNYIAEQDFNHEQELAEKDKEIAYWQARYELCLKHRLHERHERTVKWQDRITAAILAVFATGFVWLAIAAMKEFLLWASGQ